MLAMVPIVSSCAHGALSAFEFTGRITGISSLGGSTAWLDASIVAGATVSGRFVFDPQTPDATAGPHYGRYFVDAVTDPGAGFQSVTVGPYTVGGGQLPGQSGNYCAIEVTDDPAVYDSLVVEEEWMFAAGGAIVPTMGAASIFIVSDGPSDALGSDALPTTSPDLSEFIDRAGWVVLVPPTSGLAAISIDFELETLTVVPGPGVVGTIVALAAPRVVRRRRE